MKSSPTIDGAIYGKLNVPAFRRAFEDFRNHVTFISKDTGRGKFKPFSVQLIYEDQLFSGLEAGVHSFVVLKARQLGVTTDDLLFATFWAAMFPGLQGAIVTHDGPAMTKIRRLLVDVLDNLPRSHALPVIAHNRDGIVFDTPGGVSMLDYLVAGTRKKTGSLGRSRALNFALMTELAQYGDEEGFESLKDTFSDRYPFRCYIGESTAHGFNLFHDEWEDAGDDITRKQIFLAWWMHTQYRHERGTPLFDRYGYSELSDEEQKTAAIVARDFGHAISLEQWAWYRHKADPRARADFQGTAREDKEENVHQEYPSYPEEAFIATGSPFLDSRYLTPLRAKAEKTMFRAYRYRFGEKVTQSERVQVEFARQAQLKVFQEPVEGASYIVAGDAAYASSDESDRYCCQVIRVYADKCEQVAVFCERNMQTFEFTWVIVDLCAYYGNCRYILEINGSGVAVLTEFKHLKTQIENGLLNPPRSDPANPTEEEIALERSTRTMLSRVRQYLYRRPDSLAGGFNIQWMTTFQNKHGMMVQLRDGIVQGYMEIVDVETIREVQSLRQDGISIQAEGRKKDDRAVALALAHRCWIDQERSGLIARNATYAAEQARATEDGNQLAGRYMMNLLAGEMENKVRMRERRQRFERRQRWGW